MNTQQSHEDTIPRKVYIAGRQLRFGDDVRQPGQLVMEAIDWKPKIRNVHLDLGWIEAIDVLTDDARQEVKDQLAREEAARAEAAAKRKEAEAQAPPAPPPVPEGAVTLKCANCWRPNVFTETPGLRTWWQCEGCGQRQTVEQARIGSLQLVAPHAYNHNHLANYWEGGRAL